MIGQILYILKYSFHNKKNNKIQNTLHGWKCVLKEIKMIIYNIITINYFIQRKTKQNHLKFKQDFMPKFT